MSSSRAFTARPEAIREARAFVEGVLAGTEPVRRHAIVLMVSELATNSVRHAGSDFTVEISSTAGAVRVVVADRGSGEPRMRNPEHHEPTGRGLRIVDQLADEWGVGREGSAGTSVWFVVRVEAEGDDPDEDEMASPRPTGTKAEAQGERGREQASNRSELAVAA